MAVPALDQVFLGDMLDGDRKFAAELFAAFTEASNGSLELARVSCLAGEVRPATRAFHTLKGSSASVGLLKVRDLCRLLEEQAKTGELAPCLARLGELEDRVDEGKALLALFLKDLSG